MPTPGGRLSNRGGGSRCESRCLRPALGVSGNAPIERHVAPFVLSNDEVRLSRVKKSVALYRLTFGQPRQEDMLELLNQRYSAADPSDLDEMRIDLSPPRRL